MALIIDASLNTFLSTCVCQRPNEQYTHVDVIKQKYYNVPVDRFQEFMLTICDAVDTGAIHSIAEKPIDTVPIVAQVRLCYETDPEIGYTDSFVNNLIYIYQSTIMELLDLMDINNPAETICFMLEIDTSSGDKGNIVTRDAFEYRFNLHFPYCRLDKSTLQYFQGKIKEKIAKYNIPGMLSMMVANPKDIINWNYYERPMLMYGGISHKNDKPLTSVRCYSLLTLEAIHEGVVDPVDDVDEYIEYANYYSRVRNCSFGEDIFTDDSKKLFWLPILFSNDFMQKVTIAKPRQIPRSVVQIEDNTIIPEEIESYEHLINNLLPLLSDNRFINQCYWKDIGKGLYHISNGRQDALTEWYKITESVKTRIKSGRSKIDPEMAELINPDRCEELWEIFYEFGTDGITDKTIRWYAREDNRTEFDATMRPIYEHFYDQALSMKGDDVANAFYMRYMFDFLYEPGVKGGSWWAYEKHRWILDKEHMKLMDRMSKDFIQSLTSYRSRLTTLSAQVNGAERQELENKIKDLGKLIGNFKENSFHERTTKSLRRKFRVESFDTFRNENIRITVCSNGVIEVFPESKTFDGHSFFRNGKPEDYCTFSTRNNFPTDETKPLFKERLKLLDRFFEQLFVKYPKAEYDNKPLAKHYMNDSSRTYKLWMACWRSTFLIGNNEQKTMVDLYGKTHTGKSQYVKLIFYMLGDLAIKGNNKLITYNSREPGGDGPSANKARQRGKRAVCYDELSSRAPIDSTACKRESGGDTANNRDLFEKGAEMSDMKQQHKMFCTYNKYPPINDADDEAFWDRKRVCCFKTKFLPENDERVPTTAEERRLQRIYPRDPNFEVVLQQLAPVALWMAFHDYKVYASNFIKGMPECLEISNATSAYRTVADFYMDFLDLAIEKDPNSKVTSSRLYRHFTIWYGLRFPKSKPPNEIEFRQAMDNKGYTPKDFSYKGIALKSLEHIKGSYAEDEEENTE